MIRPDNLEIADPIAIRTASLRHVSDVLRLERQAPTAAHWSEAQYACLFQATEDGNARLVLVAERNLPKPDELPIIVGFLIARHIAPEWELENIVVAPEARGKGIGTRLVEELLVRAQQTKSHVVFLEVRESNAAAIALYKKLGFQQTGRRKSYYSSPVEDAILYSRNLGRAPISS